MGSELTLKMSNFEVLRVVGVSLFAKTPLKKRMKDEPIEDFVELDKLLWGEFED